MMAANLAEIQMIAGHQAEQINKGMVTQTNTLEKIFFWVIQWTKKTQTISLVLSKISKKIYAQKSIVVSLKNAV